MIKLNMMIECQLIEDDQVLAYDLIDDGKGALTAAELADRCQSFEGTIKEYRYVHLARVIQRSRLVRFELRSVESLEARNYH